MPHTFRASFIFIWGVSLTHPVLASPLCGEFLLHILCWLYFYLGSFSYTSLASVFLSFFFFFKSRELPLHVSYWLLILIWGVSLTHPMLALCLCGEFLLHIPCCLHFYAVSFLTHPMLDSFLCKEFLLHIQSWLCFCIWGASLTHPVMVSFFLSRELLSHVSCWLHFYLGSFSYTSRADFN